MNPQVDPDTLHEVLVRLPVKSIARNRCVSRSWNSRFRENHFTDAYFTRSSSSPKLLFTCLKNGQSLFFSSSSPQKDPEQDLQDHDHSVLRASFHMTFGTNGRYNVYRPVRGLVCGLYQREGSIVSVPWVCNPSTGKAIQLPNVKARTRQVLLFLGYEPTNRLFNILSMTKPARCEFSADHQVLKLQKGKRPSWKMISCNVVHDPYVIQRHDYEVPSYIDGICIEGKFYYLARVNGMFDGEPVIVWFDFLTERFGYIQRPNNDMHNFVAGGLELTLVNHGGGLAYIKPTFQGEEEVRIQLGILLDAEEHEWMTIQYTLHPSIDQRFPMRYKFLGITSVGEIVMGCVLSFAADIIYFNPQEMTIRKVRVKELTSFMGSQCVNIFLDHVEDVKLDRLT